MNGVTYTAGSSPSLSEMFTVSSSPATVTDGHATITNTLYQTTVHVLKQSGATTHDPLPNATFKLWKRITGDSYTEFATQTSSSATGSVGRLSFQNLPAGYYRLEETEAPAGYNRLGEYIYFKIAGGVVTWTDSTFETVIGDGNKPNQVEYNSANVEFVIDNTPGVELPSTGGRGTLIYTVAGMALIVLAGVLLVSRRKRKA